MISLRLPPTSDFVDNDLIAYWNGSTWQTIGVINQVLPSSSNNRTDMPSRTTSFLNVVVLIALVFVFGAK